MKTNKEKEQPTKQEKQPETFNIIPGPSEMAEKDEVLAKAYNDLLFFGRAFLPNDFLNKSAKERKRRRRKLTLENKQRKRAAYKARKAARDV